MTVNVLLLFSLRSAIMSTNGDLKISLHVCVHKMEVILWKFQILNEFFSYLPLKFYLFLKSRRQDFMFFILMSKHFNSFLVFNLCISQKVRLNVLLVARCSLLFTRCSLLVTFCSLLVTFCLLLVTFYSLLVTFCSLLSVRCSLIFCSLLISFCSFVFARYILLVCSLLTVKKSYRERQKNDLAIFHANFWDFCNFFWMVVFKVFSTCKTIFKVGIK